MESEIRNQIEEILKILDAHNKNQFAIENQTLTEQQILRRGLNLTDDKIPFEPFYYRQLTIDSRYPKIFNSRGERMHFCFIRDKIFANQPHSGFERFIVWDRFNFGLKVHAYTMEEIFKPIGSPKHKFAMLIEPRSIKPNFYDEFEQRKDWIEQNFDLVLTSDAKILGSFSNARFTPSVYRIDLPENDKNFQRINDFYAVVIEDEISPCYFSRRILNCFESKTIPIYLGAKEIGKFFNIDGIIQIQDVDQIDNVLERCTIEEYQNRLPAILDNFKRAEKFKSPIDLIYPIYLQKFFEED